MLGGEGLGQQDAGAGVDGPVRVEHGGGQRAERPVAAAARVVADQDVQVADVSGRRVDELGWRVGAAEVELGRLDAGRTVSQCGGHAVEHGLRSAGIAAPRLIPVVRRILLQEQAGAQRG